MVLPSLRNLPATGKDNTSNPARSQHNHCYVFLYCYIRYDKKYAFLKAVNFTSPPEPTLPGYGHSVPLLEISQIWT